MPMEDRRGDVQSGAGLKWAVGLAVAALFVVAGVSMAYLSRGRTQIADLTASNQALSTSVTQLKTQVLSMSQELKERPNPAPVAPAIPSRTGVARPRTQVRSAAATVDPRVTRLQSRIEDQEKALSSTRE